MFSISLQTPHLLLAGGAEYVAPLPRSARGTARAVHPHQLPVIHRNGEEYNIKKQHENQCWAAVTVSVTDFYASGGHGEWLAADLASEIENDETCCPEPHNQNCGYFKDLACILDGYTHHFESTWHVEPATISALDNAIRSEIANSRPVCCRVLLGCQRGHYVVIAGTTDSGFVVFDPDGPCIYSMPASELMNGFGECHAEGAQTWTHAYFTKESGVNQ